MTHSEQCQQQAIAQNQAREDWMRRWLTHCRNCEGAGEFYHPGTFDYQAGVGEPPSADPCICTDQGICPRCGIVGLDLETAEGPCSLCGWNYDDRAPGPSECVCDYVDVEP